MSASKKTLLAAAVAATAMAAHKPDCEDFCTRVDATCATQAEPPYANKDACLTACNPPAGETAFFGTDSGIFSNDATDPNIAVAYNNANTNTFACRDYHLSVAETSAENAGIHCPHVAKESAPCATAQCTSFCSDMLATCAGESGVWADQVACETACAAWIPVNRGSYGVSGNSLGCRVYHLEVAKGSPEAATVHCPHAGSDGGGVCVDNVANFCALDLKTCAGKNSPSLYTDCATEFAALPAGTPADTSGNTQGCRIYHLNVAYNMYAADVHCAHASENGCGVCGGEPTDASCLPEPEPEPPTPLDGGASTVGTSAVGITFGALLTAFFA